MPDGAAPAAATPAPALPTGCPIDHDFDPLAPDYLVDPYAVADRVREATPVFYAPSLDMWVVSRMEDVEAVFSDHETFSGRIVQDPVFPVCDAARAVLSEGFHPLPVMSNNEPPDHGRIRVHTTKGFSNRRMAILEPFIRANAERLVGQMLAGDRPAEFVHALAFPLPAYTVFRHIGFPDEDAEQLKRWCGNRKLFQWGRATEAEQVAIAENMVAYWHYCQAFTDAKLHDLGDDFASDLLRAHLEDPRQLTLDEVKSVVYGLSFAGHEAVTNLLCNTVRQLLAHRGQWEEVCADPELVTGAVEETLRFDSSQISWRRITKVPAVVGGVEIPAGAKVLLLFAAANHDPRRFADPDRFDIHRANARHHISFGKGIHFCLGAGTARHEARIVLDTLAHMAPSLRLAQDQDFRVFPNITFRGPEQLWLDWD
jgi:cytochrome P450